ncbi:uncharacterized protein LOC125687297 [Lagopus muta]|uniref:uncharacterized protein LOC125687297 n=1 Tax=Lagopus muta TaxID=64668 RepID=UPI00209C7A1E|nr:uncharacterized protein LOC125687297 [Lagopus muta]
MKHLEVNGKWPRGDGEGSGFQLQRCPALAAALRGERRQQVALRFPRRLAPAYVAQPWSSLGTNSLRKFPPLGAAGRPEAAAVPRRQRCGLRAGGERPRAASGTVRGSLRGRPVDVTVKRGNEAGLWGGRNQVIPSAGQGGFMLLKKWKIIGGSRSTRSTVLKDSQNSSKWKATGNNLCNSTLRGGPMLIRLLVFCFIMDGNFTSSLRDPPSCGSTVDSLLCLTCIFIQEWSTAGNAVQNLRRSI